MRRLSAFLLFACICPVLWAGPVPNSFRRHVNTLVLSAINGYEGSCSVRDDKSVSEFLSLFSTDASVVNDVLGTDRYLEQMSPMEYVEAIRSTSAYPSFAIYDVTKDEMRQENGFWIISLVFRKSVFYVDKNGYVFSSDEFYGKELSMKMTLRYKEDDVACKIVSVELLEDDIREFPEGRFVIIDKDSLSLSDSRYLNTLKIGKESPRYDRGVAMTASGKPSVKDIDVMINIDTLCEGFNYDVLAFSFRPRKSRIKLRYAYAPLGAYDVTAADGIGSGTVAMELGFDFGFMWRLGNSAKMGLFTGAGVSGSRVSLSLSAPVSYSYVTSVFNRQTGLYEDRDIRYDIASAEEAVDYLDFFVPLYFEFEHKVGNFMLVTWNLGAKAYYNYSATVSCPYSPQGRVRVYDAVSQSVAVSRPVASGNMSYVSPVSYKKNPFDISLMANLGFEFNLSKRKVYLLLRAGYEYGVTSSYESGDLRYFESGKMYPFVYDPVKGEDRPVHSLFGNVSFRRQGIWFEGGFKFKLK